MKTAIVIFNDRKIPMGIRVQDANFDSFNFTGERYVSLKPATMSTIEIDIPEGCVPYLKVWENNTAFLSYIDPKQLEGMEKSA